MSMVICEAASCEADGPRVMEGENMTDFLGLMKQASELKTKMEAMQAELEHIEVEGTAGGGMVQVTMTAKGELKSVRFDPSLMKPEEKEIAEDLVVAAHGDARRRAEALLQEKMKSLTGGLPLPPGLKLF
jgi:nucleoid-associated protein EbfC